MQDQISKRQKESRKHHTLLSLQGLADLSAPLQMQQDREAQRCLCLPSASLAFLLQR